MQYSGYLTTLQSQGSATWLAIFTLRFFPLSDPSDCLVDWPEPRGVDTTSASTGRGHTKASEGFSNFRGVFRMEFSSNSSDSSASPAEFFDNGLIHHHDHHHRRASSVSSRSELNEIKIGDADNIGKVTSYFQAISVSPLLQRDNEHQRLNKSERS